jgi:hypothetical protein
MNRDEDILHSSTNYYFIGLTIDTNKREQYMRRTIEYKFYVFLSKYDIIKVTFLL